MFTDPYDVDANLVGKYPLGHYVAEHFWVAQHAGAFNVLGDITESVQAKFDDPFGQRRGKMVRWIGCRHRVCHINVNPRDAKIIPSNLKLLLGSLDV